MGISKIGVIGAGVMGTGIAQAFSQAGINVVLIDISQDTLTSAREKIHQDLRFYQMLHRDEKIVPEVILDRINTTTDYNVLKQVDFVVESITESLKEKEKVYSKLDKICPVKTIFASNTSCISITKLASLTKREDKVLGIHFMNPVPMKKTVEVIKGYHTSNATLTFTEELMKKINKDCIIVNDLPGFVSNRLSHLFMNEAAFVVQDGVATPEQIDNIFKKCYEHKMGPLETADLIGLDTVVDSLDILFESYSDPKFRCCPLLRKMVNAGLYGRKSGKGFYRY